MGSCSSTDEPRRRDEGDREALVAGQPPSDRVGGDDGKHTLSSSPKLVSRFLSILKMGRTAAPAADGEEEKSELSVELTTATWRTFLNGAIIGCGLMTVPMTVLLWIVIENGILYKLYPVPTTTDGTV
mmetsp:Transcript_11471/g.34004  ORF Transcript_11471/g.34004 Transcript_11471/m.34004 type:complete len:128 (-) Transcript_11471:137-520(-)